MEGPGRALAGNGQVRPPSTWRARAHQQCDFVLLLTYQTNRVIPEHAGALKTARRAGIGKTVTPHTLRHAFITAALDAGVPLRDVHEAASHADPRATIRYDRARGSLDRHATYVVAAAYIAGAAR